MANKKSTWQVGVEGESLAVVFLSENNYIILNRNYRTRHGEIDIIAEDSSTLVFVEVKMKTSARYGLPYEMVTPRKLFKIQKTAESYILENDYNGPWRIDVVSILGEKIDLIKNVTS